MSGVIRHAEAAELTSTLEFQVLEIPKQTSTTLNYTICTSVEALAYNNWPYVNPMIESASP